MILRFRLDKTAKAGTKVTKRYCNISCVWCHHDYFQHGGFISIDNDHFIMAVERIIRATSANEAYVRIAGDGEPTIVGEDELVSLISGLRKIPQVSKVKLTTNGILLGRMAKALYNANIDTISVSLNSLNRERYREYSGYDYLSIVKNSIRKAYQVGLKLKINTIYWKHNGDEIDEYEKLSVKYGNMPIKFFDLLIQTENDKNYYLPISELQDQLIPRVDKITEEKWPYPKKVFKLKSGAVFEIKMSGNTNNCHNLSCFARTICLEGCRHSIRIGLDGVMRPCGVRNDNILNLFEPKITDDDIRAALKSGGKINNGFGG
jgi:GTP 3',8-cyclase